jgi:cell division protein FtsB
MKELPRLREENKELKKRNEELETEITELQSKFNFHENILPQDIEELKENKAQLEAENIELRDKIAELESNIELPTEITQEILTIYGIDSEEKLESFKQSNGGHKGGDGHSEIMHVKGIIDRAKNNVKEYLTKTMDYDCSGWNGKDTVISGVKKSGKPIMLVIRPSDGNKVIFYDSSEMQTLKLSSSELWVEKWEKRTTTNNIRNYFRKNKD